MNAQKVLLLLTDQWAYWESAYAVAEVNSAAHYSVKTISFDKKIQNIYRWIAYRD